MTSSVLERANLSQRSVSLPLGSRISGTVRAGRLKLVIPGTGSNSLGPIGALGLSLALLVFLCSSSQRASNQTFTFALCSLPLGGLALFLAQQALFAIFGHTTIRIGRKRYRIEKKFWGSVERFEGRTRELAGVSLDQSRTRFNRQRITQCVLRAKTRDIKFGVLLQAEELCWLAHRINQHLDAAAENAEWD